jgi:hypothetical protein
VGNMNLMSRTKVKELTHEGIRDSAGHRKRISGRVYNPSRRGLDPGLFGLDPSCMFQSERAERVHFHVSGIPEMWKSGLIESDCSIVQFSAPG